MQRLRVGNERRAPEELEEGQCGWQANTQTTPSTGEVKGARRKCWEDQTKLHINVALPLGLRESLENLVKSCGF